jgi:23S rRNA pseudouridine1911/1915/1917 synthase
MTQIKETIILSISVQGKQRLDKIFSLFQDYNVSRSQLQRLIKASHVKVNNIVVDDISHDVCYGDVVNIDIPKVQSDHIEAKDIPLKVIYEDEYLIVVDKPSGLTVHPGAGNKNDTLVNALVHRYNNDLSSVGGDERPGIVHRLDRNTSGLLVVAKDNVSHAKLSQQLQERDVKRKYIALIWNAPYKLSGSIVANIDRHKKHRTKMAVVLKGGKSAITHYKLLKTFCNKKISLLECVLDTGRTHQIRVHLSHKKWPIIGDPEYCNVQLGNAVLPDNVKTAISKLGRQALHAVNLSFTHPVTQKHLDLYSDLPKDINDILIALREYEDK